MSLSWGPVGMLVSWVAGTSERARSDRRVVATARTLSGPTTVVDVHDANGRPVRVLEVRDTWQSATYLDEGWCDLVFPYHRVFADCLEGASAEHPVRSALMLGGGGYAFPKWLVSHHPDVRVDVCELDPAVTALAKRYFLLDRLETLLGSGLEERLVCHEGDARAFLEGGEGLPTYDVILNDCFSGEEPPLALASLEGAYWIRGRLSPGGLYLSNVVAALEGRRSTFLRNVCRTLSEEFAHVYVVPCGADEPAVEDNNVVVATDGDWCPEGAWDLSPRPSGRIIMDPVPGPSPEPARR